jgi:hypothetical protein
MPSLSFSLTPNFSWVLSVSRMPKPFQRFSAAALETVKTVPVVPGIAATWLKPGVNENCASRAMATFRTLIII